MQEQPVRGRERDVCKSSLSGDEKGMFARAGDQKGTHPRAVFLFARGGVALFKRRERSLLEDAWPRIFVSSYLILHAQPATNILRLRR